ncbi:hypothetical protein CR513_37707, partial [Mucuna pruriens]
MARNFASTLDQATTFCFLLFQDIEYILSLGDKDTLFGTRNLYPKEFFNLIIICNNHIVYINLEKSEFTIRRMFYK